jgi:hypothetical protein
VNFKQILGEARRERGRDTIFKDLIGLIMVISPLLDFSELTALPIHQLYKLEFK